MNVKSIHIFECVLLSERGEVMSCFERIKEQREKAELKQYAVAKLLGITQQQYSLYETGQREIPVRFLMMLADLYGTSMDYLVGRTNKR